MKRCKDCPTIAKRIIRTKRCPVTASWVLGWKTLIWRTLRTRDARTNAGITDTCSAKISISLHTLFIFICLFTQFLTHIFTSFLHGLAINNKHHTDYPLHRINNCNLQFDALYIVMQLKKVAEGVKLRNYVNLLIFLTSTDLIVSHAILRDLLLR